MKFYKYKKVARINCVGFDDELTNNTSSFYNTPYKFIPNQTQINTKLMRFRFKGLNNIQIGKHAKLVLESIYVPIVLNDYNYAKNRGGFQIRLKIFSSMNTFDSSLDNHGSIVLFSHACESQTQFFFQVDDTTGHIEIQAPTDAAGNKLVQTDATGHHTVHYHSDMGNYITTKTGVSFFNNNPKSLYNFDIPNQNFLNQNMLEFELIYFLRQGEEFILADDNFQLESFQCSLVIYDIDEEKELLLQDTEEVDFKLMRPQNDIFQI